MPKKVSKKKTNKRPKKVSIKEEKEDSEVVYMMVYQII
jgi:hypothetical protein